MAVKEEKNGCLEFNKKSWHFRVVAYLFGKNFFTTQDYVEGKFVERGYHTHICEYFWTVVFCSMLFPFKAIWKSLPDKITYHDTMIKALLLWGLASIGLHVYLSKSWLAFPIEEWYWVPIIYASGVGIFFGFVGAFALIDRIDEKYEEFKVRKSEAVKEKKPSLFKEFFKAKKERICPCIKFVDDDEQKWDKEDEH